MIDDPDADLEVRAWRFSYNARGIIEVPNRLRSSRTAVIVVHPWGIDDGQGWRTPEPAGVAFQCTPVKNKIVLDHAAKVINPFLKTMRAQGRPAGGLQPAGNGGPDSPEDLPFAAQSAEPTRNGKQGERELKAKLAAFDYHGQAIPTLDLAEFRDPGSSYFKQFPGLDCGTGVRRPGFWELPIPVMKSIEVDLRDFVIYDGEGYPALRGFLRKQGIRHVLLAGYNTDMCVCSTTAGYKNLAQDFDVFLVGDATIATFPAQPTPRFATTTAVCFAALDLFITQVSWVRPALAARADTDRAAAEQHVPWSRSMQPDSLACVTRRSVSGFPLLAGLPGGFSQSVTRPAPSGKALIAITLDLEMSRNFPTWDQTHWDYEKGNLDAPTKRYAVEAARRVKARGGVIHFFAVGQTMEQEDVGWLREIVAQGHPVGNHTYDHVNVKATRSEDIQFRFRRAPWLIDGKDSGRSDCRKYPPGRGSPQEKARYRADGFRTPGGFANGLADRPDLQALLLKLGYTWVSSQYPAHPIADTSGKQPGRRRSWPESSPRSSTPSRSFTHRAWSKSR